MNKELTHRSVPARTALLLSCFIPVLLLTGCLTKAPTIEPVEITNKVADLTITLSPVDYETLKELFGSNRRDYKNPFIDYPGQIPQRRIVVFDAVFTTETSTIDVALKAITLGIGGQTGEGASAEYLSQLWSGYIEGTPYVSKLPAVAHRTMLEREFTIAPGKPAKGYLVFAERYPKEGGEGLLTIPVTADNGDRGTIEFEMSFSQYGVDAQKLEANTGMFADEAEQPEVSTDKSSESGGS